MIPQPIRSLLPVKIVGLVALFAGLGTASVRAQCDLNEFQKLLASDGTAFDNFGRSVAIQGNLAIVGASWDDDNGGSFGAGSAYVFRHDGSEWVEEAKLLASDGEEWHEFGWSVDIFGNLAIVGAPVTELQNPDVGRAYLFRYDALSGSWSELQKLEASDGDVGDRFGFSVALRKGVAIVGAPLDNNENGVAAGAAYHYRSSSTGWFEFEKVLPSDGTLFESFGHSVAMDGDRVAIGMPQPFAVITPGPGAVYVYSNHKVSGLIGETKLVAADGQVGDELGRSVDVISGSSTSFVTQWFAPQFDVMSASVPAVVSSSRALVLAGAPEDSGAAGSAYVFSVTPTSWSQQAKLEASDGDPQDQFGWSVALETGVAMVGSIHDDDAANDAGAAYLFSNHPLANTPWTLETKLTASDGAASDLLGISVAIDGARGLVGAPAHDASGSLAGAAYAVHGLSNCNLNKSLDACDLQSGSSLDLNGNGVPDECE